MTSYANASSETSQDNSNDNTKRDRKTQALSALLSATALGVFLEGCGGEDVPASAPPPTPAVLGSASNPFVGTAEANVFVGSVGADWVSYAGATPNGVLVDLLGAPENNLGWALGDTLTGIRNIIGSPQGDTLIGNGEANTLRGGLGGDAINGNDGTDTVSYSSASKGVRVDLSSAVAQVDFTTEAGFAENQNEAVGDTLSSIENIEGSAHADWLMGDGGNNIIRGGGGGDTISGGGGDDTIDGGAGEDTLDGGDGGDTLSYANEGVAVVVNLDDEGAQTSNLDTISNFENVIGGANNDELTGDGNVNTLNGGAGADTLHGNDGSDTVSYSGSSKGVRVALALTDAQQDFETNTYGFVGNANEAVGDTLATIENIEGSAHADWLTGGVGDNTITGGAGNDRLEGGAGGDTIDGGAGVDTLEGGAGADTYIFRVGDGTDTITDVAGETMTLRFIGDYAGTDFIAGSNARFTRDGNNLVFTFVKDGSTDKVTIEDAYNTDGSLRYTIDVEYGTAANSLATITSDNGYWSNLEVATGEGTESNPFLATSGSNVITGEDGLDWVSYAGSIDAGVKVNLGASGDNIGWAEHDTLTNIRNIIGSPQGDTLVGDGEDNTFHGGASGDTLKGNAGDDTLEGGVGGDTLEGGAGADTYIFRVGDGTDIITDAEGNTMTLRFLGTYEEGDFTDTTPLFAREGNKLVISIDKDATDSITDKVTINRAYDTDSSTGTGNSAFTINIQYGTDGDNLATIAAVNRYWHGLDADGSESQPFEGTGVADSFTGEDGLDWVSYAGATANGVLVDLLGTPGDNLGLAKDDILTGIRNIIGTAQGDTLIGDDNPNTLRGGASGDTLNGKAGGDTLEGGEGTDTASYSSAGKGVRVALSLTGVQQDFTEEHDFVANQNEAVGDTLSSIENIVGSNHNDWLTGDGKDNTFSGNKGNDRLEGGAGADTYIFRVGDGTDTITDVAGGTMTLRFIGSYVATDFAADRTGGPLFARDGNNLVITIDKATGDGITDKVTITGGNLLYTINVQYGTEGSLTEVAAADAYWNSEGSEGNPFVATAEANPFTGSGTGSTGFNWVSYADLLGAGSINIILSDNPATAATVEGAATGDTLINIQNIIGSSDEVNVLYGNDNANILRGGGVIDTLRGYGGDDTLDGGAGSDEVRGGFGNDIIFGGAGGDTLYGDGGTDTLDGGAGDDPTIFGGTGADTYIFRVGDGTDTILDIAGDTMTLRFIGAYVEGDFTEASDNFDRVVNNLVITLVKGGVTDTVTISSAYDTDSSTGTGNSAYTIEVEYGIEGSDSFSEVTLANSYWHNL